MRGHIAHILATVLLVVSLGAAQRPNKSESVNTGNKAIPVASGKTARTKPYQIGTASWYGSYFQGRATASGEPYDMYDLTAAHPTLPLGSWVRVTNLRNGRAVVVRINDRGPIVPGRIIDLSYNTARVLHFDSKGLQRVRLDVVNNRARNTQPQMIAALQY
ncbi:MAG: septal ring lytic transglycosylase RlpA family protein [Terriglobales bacterium]